MLRKRIDVLYGRPVVVICFPSGYEQPFGPFKNRAAARKWSTSFLEELGPYYPMGIIVIPERYARKNIRGIKL